VSSGALNGVAYAAGVRAHCTVDAATRLVAVWEDEASLTGAVNLRLWDFLRGTGFSDNARILALLRANVPACRSRAPSPIDLHVVVASLRGTEHPIGPDEGVSYTQVLSFNGNDFDGREQLEHVFLCASASAALPILFSPVDLPGIGPCIDGGLVADLPIRLAVDSEDGSPHDALLFVEPTASDARVPRSAIRYFRLGGYLLDVVFSERRYQDLCLTFAENAGLAKLEQLAAEKGLSAETLQEIKVAVGWRQKRVAPVIAIRPTTPLPGDLLSGLLRRDLRRSYVQAGIERATDVFDELGWV
jgi:hypothetical protein